MKQLTEFDLLSNCIMDLQWKTVECEIVCCIAAYLFRRDLYRSTGKVKSYLAEVPMRGRMLFENTNHSNIDSKKSSSGKKGVQTARENYLL